MKLKRKIVAIIASILMLTSCSHSPHHWINAEWFGVDMSEKGKQQWTQVEIKHHAQ